MLRGHGSSQSSSVRRVQDDPREDSEEIDVEIDSPIFEPGGSDLRLKPAKTIKTQLKNRAAITRHLVDLYLDGKYKLKDLGKCMDLTGSELRREAYQVVPVHERPDHEYLVAKRDRSKKRTLEERYMRDEITLTEYNDMKDPETRERRLGRRSDLPVTGTAVYVRDLRQGRVRPNPLHGM